MHPLLITGLLLVCLGAVYFVLRRRMDQSRIIVSDENHTLARLGNTVEVYRPSQRRVLASYFLKEHHLLGRIRLDEEADDVLIVERAHLLGTAQSTTRFIDYHQIATAQADSRDDAVQKLLDYWADQQEKKQARSEAIKKLTT